MYSSERRSSRRRAAMLAVALFAACATTALTARIAHADTDQSLALSNFQSNDDRGYWQDCNDSDSCDNFGVDYTWNGGWSVDRWDGEGPGYGHTLDYEGISNSCCGFISSYGDSVDGRNDNISIKPGQWIDECYHSRSDCGSEYTDYSTQRDGSAYTASTSCPGTDFCYTIRVDNFERDGYIDPGIFTGACEWPTSTSGAVGSGGDCDSAGAIYDMGQ
jgi:hypothetical protein